MGLTTKHAKYQERLPDWEQMEDTYAGERRVKEEGEKYLPVPQAYRTDGYPTVGTDGYAAYAAFKVRARFPSVVADAVDRMVGVMHKELAAVELPDALKGMEKVATSEGESLHALLRRTNEAQLTTGRFGLLLDVPTGTGPDALPYFSCYGARAIVNWATSKDQQGKPRLEVVVLEEDASVLDEGLEWQTRTRHRVLMMESRAAAMGLREATAPETARALRAEGGADRYCVVVVDADGSLEGSEYVVPHIAGRPLAYIPFAFVNPTDLAVDPDEPPLLGLSNLALTIYRGEADHRHTLYMQGQETLVLIGGRRALVDKQKGAGASGDKLRVGAGALIEVPLQGDAKYIGISASGLAEQRTQLENDYKHAEAVGTSLLDFGDASQQSGDALRIRVAANTASLVTIARTAGAAVQQALRWAHEWKGVSGDPEEVVRLEPNLEFADDRMTGQDLAQMQTAKMAGAPISQKTIHDNMLAGGITKMTFEEELEAIAGEEPIDIGKVEDSTEVDDETTRERELEDAEAQRQHELEVARQKQAGGE